MSLLMRDSTNPFDIPLDGLDAVAGYGDGLYQWTSEGWARFQPPIVSLSIVVSAYDQGDILDVETGAATPWECSGWADRFQRAGRRAPTIYCNRNTIAVVRQAMGPRPFDWWAATLDNTTFGTEGAVAVQTRGSALTGGHYDESVILDPTWVGLGGDPVTLDPAQQLQLKNTNLDAHATASLLALGVQTDPVLFQPQPDAPKWIVDQLAALNSRLDALKAAIPASGGLTAEQAQQLAAAAAAIARIEAGLKTV